MNPQGTNELEDLLSNGNWVRGLARQLLWDKNMVDDVVQEVWITAIHRPPREPAAMRGWLRAVVHGLARRANRTGVRRRQREEKSPQRAVPPRPDEIAGRLEIQQALSSEVLSLEEPYRSVVYLRFFEEMRPIEIARETGASDSTVRSQLKRGLEQLRGKLDQRFGERERWQMMLVPFVALPGAGVPGWLEGTEAAAGGSGGGGVWGWPQWAGAVSVILIAAGVLTLTSLSSSSGSVDTAAYDASAEPTPPASALDAELPRSSASLVHARAASDESDPRPEASESDSVAEVVAKESSAPQASLRVLDAADGAPIDGAEVHLLRALSPLPVSVGVTNHEGLATVDRAELAREALVVTAPGYREARLAAARRQLSERPYVVLMEPAVEAAIAVRFASGEPAVGVKLRLRSYWRDLPSQPPLELESDSNGEVHYLAEYRQAIATVEEDGYAAVSTMAETPFMTVSLIPASRRSLQVRDEDGRAVVAALVELKSANAGSVAREFTTDERGQASIGFLADEDEVSITVRADGYPAFAVTERPPQWEGSASESSPWVIELPLGVRVRGTVVESDGTPIFRAHVFVVRPKEVGATESKQGVVSSVNTKKNQRGRSRFQYSPMVRVRAGADGQFELGPLVPRPEDLLLLYHPRFANRLIPLGEALPEEKHLELGAEFSMGRGVVVSGRVVGEDGEPRSGVLLHMGEIWSNDAENVLGRTRSDEDGLFRFTGVPEKLGSRLAGPGSLVRESLVLAAFTPDHVVGRLSVEGTLSGPELPRAIRVLPGEAEVVVVVGTRRENENRQIHLRDAEGNPVDTWTPFLWLGEDDRVGEGALGRHLQGEFFFNDRDLTHRGTGHLLLMPVGGYRWQDRWVGEDDAREVPIELQPRLERPWRLIVHDSAGNPASEQPVAIGFPFGVSRPTTHVVIGATDRAGRLEVDFLVGSVMLFVGSGKSGGELGEVVPADETVWRPLGQHRGGSFETSLRAPLTR